MFTGNFDIVRNLLT